MGFGSLKKLGSPAVLFALGTLFGAFVVLALAGGTGLDKVLFSFAAPQHCVGQSGVSAWFSPGIESKLVAFVDSAEKTLDVEVYQFSYAGLKDALVRAKQRGVRVRLLMEPRVTSNFETAAFLASKGVEVKWASQEYSNTHSKFAVADSGKVFVGSVNWSRHAMFYNREAGVLVEDLGVAAEFEKIFEWDWADAVAFSSG